jgi:GH43 family beta-xylosidase
MRHLTALLLAACAGLAQAAPNPVLPGAADGGVLRFGGRYYFMGVGTDGGIWTSRDLVNWEGPVHAFSMNNDWTSGPSAEDNQIHACDFRLIDGKFHLFWSVNYLDAEQDVRAIGRAVADNPLGPYIEPETDKPFAEKIDPHLYVDSDGKRYFYTVKFTEGNVIFGQPMEGTDTLVEPARPLLTAVPGTWEFRDHRVNEAPDVTRRGNSFYMLYNGNHTGVEYGNYAIGLAVADAPLGFNDEGKLPAPVLTHNRARVLATGTTLIPTALQDRATWRYSPFPPLADWTAPDYDDSVWFEGPGGFGRPDDPVPGGRVNTEWNSNGIWLRNRFTLDIVPEHPLALVLHHDAAARVWINGVEAVASDRFRVGYGTFPISPAARAALRTGENVIAVQCLHDGGNQYLDAGLLDPGPDGIDQIITNCGQPNMVLGPNGFEWWVTYFAHFNGGPARDQAIDRVFFTSAGLFIDGPTSARTPGYHPAPSLPGFREQFEKPGPPTPLWRRHGGQWDQADGLLVQSSAEGFCRVMAELAPATRYMVETSVDLSQKRSADAGLVIWQKDADNYILAGLRGRLGHWYYQVVKDGVVQVTDPMQVPTRLDPPGWHMLRAYVTGNNLEMWVDDILPTRSESLRIPVDGPGITGLFTRDTPARFTGFSLTRGWSERAATMEGWGAALDGTLAAGVFVKTDQGMLAMPSGTEPVRVFKGDPLDQYEFSAVLRQGHKFAIGHASGFVKTSWIEDDQPQVVAIVPVYRDADNYLRIECDQEFTTMRAVGMRGGEPFATDPVAIPASRPLQRMQPDGDVHLRAVKLGDRVIAYLDGAEILTVPGVWPASQPGLWFSNTFCLVSATECFERTG